MADKTYKLQDKNGLSVTVSVRRDRRLKKSSRWQWQAKDSILLRVPYRLPNRIVNEIVEKIAAQLKKQERLAERRTDAGLQQRAEALNRKYFNGRIEWRAIRWVSNMNARLGSCTNGGVTEGHIRISDKIKDWPQWVVDYIIAHEMVHRLHPNHSQAFWETLTGGYPLVERARGFIRGVGFAQGAQFEEDDSD
jgi:predicted metal-dependent hydrolase